jgi:protease-4
MELLQEFLTSNIMLRDAAVPALETYISQHINRPIVGEPALPEKKPVFGVTRIAYPDFWAENPFIGVEPGAISLIPLKGLMQKHSAYTWGGGYRRGVDEIANTLRLADLNPNIAAHILLINTPGGASDSIYQMEDALRSRTKPCIALIDGQCCSGGIYVASFCDEIYAINRLCEIGSIGIYATIIDDTKILEQIGIKIIVIYPPESKYKNLQVREAIEGKPDRIIKEVLTPFAQHFQDTVKGNRKNLDLTVEGIIEGRVFYAYEAEQNGLIDGIKNLNAVIDRALELADLNKSIINSINKS